MNASKVPITIDCLRVHTNMNHIISYAYHIAKLKDYNLECTGWTAQIFYTVDWEVLELYTTTLKDTHCTNVVKLIHD